MTPKQLRKFLDDSGLSQRGAARELGIGERTMRRYIAGDLPVPLLVELGLFALMLRRIDPRQAAKHATREDVKDMRELRQWVAEFSAELEKRRG